MSTVAQATPLVRDPVMRLDRPAQQMCTRVLEATAWLPVSVINRDPSSRWRSVAVAACIRLRCRDVDHPRTCPYGPTDSNSPRPCRKEVDDADRVKSHVGRLSDFHSGARAPQW